MAMNVYKIRKWAATFINGFFPVFFFFVGLLYFDFYLAIALMFVGIILGSLVSGLLTRNAFTDMLEGKGLLTLTLDSTGVIDSFITGLKAPFIHGYLKGKEVDGLYNRDIVHYLNTPTKGNVVEIEDEKGKITRWLKLPEENKKPENLFGFGPYPCFIFNKNINSYLSKDSLSTFEKDVFTKQHALFILKKTEELGQNIRDFARYIVEQARPKKLSLLQNKWLLYVIIIAAVIVLMLLFGPALFQAFTNFGSNAGNLIPSGGGGPVN